GTAPECGSGRLGKDAVGNGRLLFGGASPSVGKLAEARLARGGKVAAEARPSCGRLVRKAASPFGTGEAVAHIVGAVILELHAVLSAARREQAAESALAFAGIVPVPGRVVLVLPPGRAGGRRGLGRR